MANEIYKKISGYQKLTGIFGYWPSFHDAEVLVMTLDRRGRDEWEGPILYVKIHVFEMINERIKDSNKLIFRHHAIVTFRFTGVKELSLRKFNNQNAIYELKFTETLDNERKTKVFEVLFDSSYGVGCSFLCDSIEITNLKKKLPKHSVYRE